MLEQSYNPNCCFWVVVVFAPGLAGTSGELYICDIIKFLDHVISSSVSQLIKDKSRDIQKLLKYLME